MTAAPILPCLHPQSLEVVLYYKASHTDLDGLLQEEVEEEKEEEIKKDTKQDSCNELVSVPSEPTEMRSPKAEEGCYEESQEQEGKEEDRKVESDNDACPEASEGNNPLRLSESKKVTVVEGWIAWEVGSGPQVPWCGRVTWPEDRLLQECPGPPALRPRARGEWRWSRECWKWALHDRWWAESTLCGPISEITFSGSQGGAVAVLPPFASSRPRSFHQEVFCPSPGPAPRSPRCEASFRLLASLCQSLELPC